MWAERTYVLQGLGRVSWYVSIGIPSFSTNGVIGKGKQDIAGESFGPYSRAMGRLRSSSRAPGVSRVQHYSLGGKWWLNCY